MSIKRIVADDQDGTEIQPGALHISGSFTIEFPGGITQTGDLDFGSFESVIAYVQAQQAKYQAAQPVTPAPTP